MLDEYKYLWEVNTDWALVKTKRGYIIFNEKDYSALLVDDNQLEKELISKMLENGSKVMNEELIVNNRCPECGALLIETREGSSLIISCVNCDYCIATTYIEPIYEDDTEYIITIEQGNEVNKDTVMLIMNITGLNLIRTSDILRNHCPYELMKGDAIEIKEMKKRLDERGFIYRISPDYKW